jgi:hypothetical protein
MRKPSFRRFVPLSISLILVPTFVALGFIGAIGAAENSDAQLGGGASIRFSMTVR